MDVLKVPNFVRRTICLLDRLMLQADQWFKEALKFQAETESNVKLMLCACLTGSPAN